jgi:hypothetical protein
MERAEMATTTLPDNSPGLGISIREPAPITIDSALSVFVVFTSINLTLRALEKGRELANALGIRSVVVMVQTVPFPLPLNEPPAPMEFIVRRFEERAGEFPEKMRVSAYLCRDPMAALRRILNSHCPVVMAVRKRWWPTRDERLARKLSRAGYDLHLLKVE